MKNILYIKRLIKFAEHLKEIENHPEEGLIEKLRIVAFYGTTKMPFEMNVPGWVFDELVNVFDEWEFDEFTGEPRLNDPSISCGTYHDICEFFDLSLDELSIFDMEGFQMIGRYGGKVLNFESSTKDIGFNFMELARVRIEGNT